MPSELVLFIQANLCHAIWRRNAVIAILADFYLTLQRCAVFFLIMFCEVLNASKRIDNQNNRSVYILFFQAHKFEWLFDS